MIFPQETLRTWLFHHFFYVFVSPSILVVLIMVYKPYCCGKKLQQGGKRSNITSASLHHYRSPLTLYLNLRFENKMQ